MRPLRLLAIAIAILLIPQVAASSGAGQFRAEGETRLEGIDRLAAESPAYVGTVVRSAVDATFDLRASEIVVERTWAEAVLVNLPDPSPLGGAEYYFETQRDSVRLQDAVVGGVQFRDAHADPALFPAQLVGWGAPASLEGRIEAVSLLSAVDATADAWDTDLAVDPPFYAEIVPIEGASLAASLGAAGVLLTGNFTLYVFGYDYVVDAPDGPQAFSTGYREGRPGFTIIEKNVLHVTDGTFLLRGADVTLHASSLQGAVDGSIIFDEATGYYDEERTRWESRGLPGVLQGTFVVEMSALPGTGESGAAFVQITGDLTHATLSPDRIPGPGLDAATAAKGAAWTGGAVVLVAGSVLLARRGRERWVAGHVDDPNQCVERALAAQAEGRPKDALRWYRRARQLAPRDALLALDEGLATEAASADVAAARRAYEEALRLDPDLAEAHLRYARTLAVQGLAPSAFSHLGRAFALEPALAAEARDDPAFAGWRDHPRFAQLLRHYGR